MRIVLGAFGENVGVGLEVRLWAVGAPRFEVGEAVRTQQVVFTDGRVSCDGRWGCHCWRDRGSDVSRFCS